MDSQTGRQTHSTNSRNYRLANVAGTQEPIYGPTAIKSVALEAEKTPFTELKREDLAWQAMDSTSVETASFYVMGDNGYVALAQVIYSNVAYAPSPLSMRQTMLTTVSDPAASEPPASSTARSSVRTRTSPTSGVRRPSTTSSSATTRTTSTPMTAPSSCPTTAPTTPSRA